MTLKLRNLIWQTGDRPLVMGILNVTSDSFSDGGLYCSTETAVDHAMGMIDEGADLIDIGAESTRPGATPVSASVQMDRVCPVIEAIRRRHGNIPLSIDTQWASVAATALDAGADIVNDISALRQDQAMVDVVASRQAAVILMHMQGKPETMQVGGGPSYENVILEIKDFLQERMDYALRQGIDTHRIILDPGLGFGKKVQDNLLILKNLDSFVALGAPMLMGASRKSFLGKVLGIEDPLARHAGTLACSMLGLLAGVTILRVHDVQETVEVVHLCQAIRRV